MGPAWTQTGLFFAELPEDPNRQMALFKVNTGNREEEICNLRWAWEIPMPELKTSVFVVPGELVKNGDITTHYSAAEIAELITAVNKIDRSLATPSITLLRVAA